jgi:hypothetical protein
LSNLEVKIIINFGEKMKIKYIFEDAKEDPEIISQFKNDPNYVSAHIMLAKNPDWYKKSKEEKAGLLDKKLKEMALRKKLKETIFNISSRKEARELEARFKKYRTGHKDWYKLTFEQLMDKIKRIGVKRAAIVQTPTRVPKLNKNRIKTRNEIKKYINSIEDQYEKKLFEAKFRMYRLSNKKWYKLTIDELVKNIKEVKAKKLETSLYRMSLTPEEKRVFDELKKEEKNIKLKEYQKKLSDERKARTAERRKQRKEIIKPTEEKKISQYEIEKGKAEMSKELAEKQRLFIIKKKQEVDKMRKEGLSDNAIRNVFKRKGIEEDNINKIMSENILDYLANYLFEEIRASI